MWWVGGGGLLPPLVGGAFAPLGWGGFVPPCVGCFLCGLGFVVGVWLAWGVVDPPVFWLKNGDQQSITNT